MRIAILVLLAVAVAPAVPSRASTASFQVIVHPDNPVDSISRDFARRAYLKKVKTWSGGAKVKPIDLPKGASARDRFTRDILKKTPAQLRSFWNQQVFSGKGVPPPEADSTAAAIAYVTSHAGAIAYIPADADPGDAKVVTLE